MDLNVQDWNPAAQVAFAFVVGGGFAMTYYLAWRRKNPPKDEGEAAMRRDFRAAIDDVRSDFETAISASTKAFDVRFDGQETIHTAAFVGLQSEAHKTAIEVARHGVQIANLEREVFRDEPHPHRRRD